MKETNRAAARLPEPQRGNGMVAVHRGWLMAALALFAMPWIVVAAIYLRGGDPPPDPQPASTAAGSTTVAAAGPWGHLSKTPIIVSPPLEYVAADWGREEGVYRWYFPGTSPDLLHTFLSSTGLTPDQVRRLAAAARFEGRISGLTLEPDLDLLRSLDPQVRARLYLQLAKSPLNQDQGNSFRFFGSSPHEWFDGTMMSPDTRALIEPLVYRDADIMHFADAEIVRKQIPDLAERQRLAKALLRQPTMLVRLTVDASSEIPELVQYWGRGGRATDVNAALASMRQDYYIVESGYQLGDIIAFVDGEGDLFHVVVYLADDLVFTKNGTSPVSPWTIMPLERVRQHYRNQSDNPRLIYHRRNEF